MSMPWRSSSPCISTWGTAAPPQTTTRTVEVSTSLSSRYWSTCAQTVGTPAEHVTFSLSISRAMGSPWRKRSGMTSVAQVTRVAVAHDDEVLDRVELRRDLRQHLDQRVVHEQHAVVRVIDDVGDLLREEPDVHGVEHGAHRRNRQVRLEVLLVVPHER